MYYVRKKLCVTATIAALAFAATATVAAAVVPLPVKTNGNMCMPVALKMAKYQRVKPSMALHLGKVEAQTAVLSVVPTHPSLAPACKLAQIDSSKKQAAYSFFASNPLV